MLTLYGPVVATAAGVRAREWSHDHAATQSCADISCVFNRVDAACSDTARTSPTALAHAPRFSAIAGGYVFACGFGRIVLLESQRTYDIRVVEYKRASGVLHRTTA